MLKLSKRSRQRRKPATDAHLLQRFLDLDSFAERNELPWQDANAALAAAFGADWEYGRDAYSPGNRVRHLVYWLEEQRFDLEEVPRSIRDRVAALRAAIKTASDRAAPPSPSPGDTAATRKLVEAVDRELDRYTHALLAAHSKSERGRPRLPPAFGTFLSCCWNIATDARAAKRTNPGQRRLIVAVLQAIVGEPISKAEQVQAALRKLLRRHRLTSPATLATARKLEVEWLKAYARS